MLFNSAQFLIFFPIVVLIYFIIPQKLKKIWLLVSSYYFYMSWNAKYALLILFSTIITYFSGLLIEKFSDTDSSRRFNKRLILIVCIILNLSILFFFKYLNFATDILSNIFKIFNLKLNIPTFDIMLPVGISFYTFQALSYTIDVYRNEISAEKNFFKYALFVSFFPQLVAGPIERSKNLLNQLSIHKKFNFDLAREGFLLMIWGFFLKIVLADRIAIFVDAVYGNYNMFSGWYLILATIFFAFQIYCDFYGYSVIAMGAAKILGINLMENFNAPYLSFSVAEFWKKWHISLTSWFKDYLYIPLGGNKKGTVKKYLNKLIVFCVSGLWHGASLTFVIWGFLNGIYLVIGEILKPLKDKFVKVFNLNRDTIGHKILQLFITFILIDIAWIFFRASSINDAFNIIKSILSSNNPWILFDGSLYKLGLDSKNFWLMIYCICILIFADYLKYKKVNIRNIIIKQDYWFRWLVMIVAICSILVFGIWGSGYDTNGFIYFQF